MKFGKAFSDNVVIVQSQRSHRGKERDPGWWQGRGRALLFATILLVSSFILIWRLFRLTIIDGFRFRSLADGNRTRELVSHAPRGLIVDRTGVPLVKNEETTRQNGPYVEIDYNRVYPFGEALAHVIGYTGELTQAELADEYYSLRRYLSGDRIGRMGAEAYFEEKLHGRDGRELVEVDASGNAVRTLGTVEATQGETVELSLDATLAQVVSSVFPVGTKGAVVVSKPTTGEILAIYSAPSFNPNGFTLGQTNERYQALKTNPDEPMFFRAIGGVYPPGSTFKLVTAVSALEEGAVRPDTLIEDTGVITIGPFSYPNWNFLQYGKTEGLVDIVRAIQRSNDIYFYKAGEAVGIERLHRWARKLGVGSPLGIEIAGEAAGLMPDPAWKKEQFTSRADLEARNHLWFLGDTYHVAIGQGYLLTTPLQVNTWTNVVANGGKLCRPTIKKRISDCKDLGIKNETIQLITEGMKKACETGGTGWPFFTFTTPVACKTGTAEFGDPDNKTHAWFTAFAPVEEPASGEAMPEISVTVLVEGAGEGSNVAAPIAKKILEEWFSR